MTSGMAKYWIIPRVGDKEPPRVGHQLASCSLLIPYVLIFFLCPAVDPYLLMMMMISTYVEKN